MRHYSHITNLEQVRLEEMRLDKLPLIAGTHLGNIISYLDDSEENLALRIFAGCGMVLFSPFILVDTAFQCLTSSEEDIKRSITKQAGINVIHREIAAEKEAGIKKAKEEVDAGTVFAYTTFFLVAGGIGGSIIYATTAIALELNSSLLVVEITGLATTIGILSGMAIGGFAVANF